MDTDQRLNEVEQRARDLIMFANGVESAGMVEYAQRARVTADDALRLAFELRAERGLRVAMQQQRDEARRLVLERQAA